ncbi:MAG: MBL fold metallo-hydrolase [Chloroflexi bacterium]|nr:MBL fold metallo-hydrolase [Chloroflexota bacterium]
MQIEYLAHSCFLLTSQSGFRVMIDPYDPKIGYGKIQRHTDLILVTHSHTDHNNISGVPGAAKVFASAGEKDFNGVKVSAMISMHGGNPEDKFNLVFSISMDGIKIAHMGDLGEIPGGPLLDFLEGTQVLMIPVGGKFTIDAVQAQKIVELIKPSVVIPMHFRTAAIDRVRLPLAPVEDFSSLFANTKILRESVFEIKAGDLPEKTEVVVMNHTY